MHTHHLLRTALAATFVTLGSAAAAAAQGTVPAAAATAPRDTAAARAATAARTVSFADAVQIALRQNAAVRQAANANALDAVSVRQQKLQFLPSLSLNTSTAQNLGRSFNQTEGTIVNQTTQSVTAGVSSSVTLFDGLQNVANLRSAQRAQDASEQDLARARQTAVFTVASDYLNLVTGQEQLRVQEENLRAQEALERQVDRLVAAGTRPVSDQYQQRATTASARAAVVDARNAVELAKVDLIQTLRLDAGASYDFAAPVVNDTAAAAARYDLDALLQRALAGRVDLDAQEARVAAASEAVKAAGSTRWPTVSLTVGYNTAYTSASDLAFADQLDQRRGGSIGIGLSIPLFDRGSTSAATQRAQVEQDNARLALDTQRQTVALEVRRAYLDFNAAQEKLRAAEAQAQSAAQAVNATQQRYQVGAATLVELTTSRAAQVEAASALVSARYTLVFQQALMAYYTGELDPAQAKIA